MSARRFDAWLMVDWSAAGRPVRGPNSIWWALSRPGRPTVVENAPTRAAAVETVACIAAEARAAGDRLLAGFDFPFGYPTGVAERLGGPGGWRALWALLGAQVADGPDNANDRFGVAARLNATWPGDGPFWGNGTRTDHAGLPRRKPAGYGAVLPAEWRLAETYARARRAVPKTVWQLAGAGSVGGQALTGIAALDRLRRDPRMVGAQVWPFETGFGPGDAPLVLAEIYPSLLPVTPREGEVLDAAQVRTVADRLAILDAEERLVGLFAAPPDLAGDAEAAVVAEEGWILGLGHAALTDRADAPRAPRPARAAPRLTVVRSSRQAPQEGTTEGDRGPPVACPVPLGTLTEMAPPRLTYERDPARIYAQSFATARAEARLDHLPADLRDTGLRLVHACGMPDVANRLAWSDDVACAVRRALDAGAPILCDCEMVASGIIRRLLPPAVEVLCTLNDAATPPLAQAIGNTRSAAAVELWRARLGGAIVVIGNAPTALFHLLELLDAGWPRPAAILGFPVGFVGAAESKAALARDPRGVAFLALRGRRGGSAMAAAALNGLAAGLETRAP